MLSTPSTLYNLFCEILNGTLHAYENQQGLNPVTAAELSPGDSVVSPRDEVVSVGGELGIPHGVVVPLVAHETRERLQAPQPHRSVLGARQQVVPKKKKIKIKTRGDRMKVCDLRSRVMDNAVTTSGGSAGLSYRSGLKLMPYTGPLCPWRILDSLAVFSSMILSSTSSDSLSIRLRSSEGNETKGRK